MANYDRTKILFADDNEDDLELMQIQARNKDWDSDIAVSAKEMIDKVNDCRTQEYCFSAIVSDINFSNNFKSYPRSTGPMAVREIRTMYPHIPVIFVSGNDNLLVRDEIERIGNCTLLTKPVDQSILFKLIEEKSQEYKFICNYEGIERRVSDSNPFKWSRRTSDIKIAIPDVLERLLIEARSSSAAMNRSL